MAAKVRDQPSTDDGALGSTWLELLSFVPSFGQQRALMARGGRWLSIAEAFGPVIFDYFGVRVYELPRLAPSPEQLLLWTRLELNQLVDPRLARFRAITTADERLWRSRSPQSALFHLEPREETPLMCVDASAGHWRAATVSTRPKQEPLMCGNREWGFTEVADGGWVFYSRGVERASDRRLIPWQRLISESTCHLWSSFQRGLERAIRANGGSALAEAPVTFHRPWEDVFQ